MRINFRAFQNMILRKKCSDIRKKSYKITIGNMFGRLDLDSTCTRKALPRLEQ